MIAEDNAQILKYPDSVGLGGSLDMGNILILLSDSNVKLWLRILL